MLTPPDILATGPELSINASSSPYIHNLSSRVSVVKNDNRQDEIELAETSRKSDRSQPADSDTHSNDHPPRTNTLLAKVQFASLCWSLFLAGWNDGTTGPLLPRIQEVYHVGFAVVSLIFVANCIGFVTGSLSNIWLTRKLGFGKIIVLGSLAQTIGYCFQSPAPPFPVFVIGYGINGFGLALQDAQANGYVASYKSNGATLMGVLHAVYGAGALASPLVATQFAQLPHWSFHYLCSLGVALSNTIALAAIFRFQTQEECLAEIGEVPTAEERDEIDANEDDHYSQIFKLKALHLLAFFTLVYVGVEVTIGGWIVTFIIDKRGGGPSSGYISAGFFGGLALGRVALLWLNRKVGERRIIFRYILLAIGQVITFSNPVLLEIIVWLVPSLIGDAVAVSFVGMLLGPVYPIIMNESGRILPRWLLTGCIGWIAGFGQTGSAALPFMTGAISSAAGIGALQPLLVSMMGLLLILWALIPKAHQRAD
ncbi:MFS general substrate transporter [Amylostereum chailletii]|nr:MFS general substrate transporter [Amylostereum chailletii]